MSAALLERLGTRGVRLEVDGDQLNVHAPKGIVTPDLLEEVRACKSELIAALRPPSDQLPLPSTAFLVIRPDGLSAWLCTDERAVAWAEAQGDGVPVLTVAEVLRIGSPADVPLVLMAKKLCGNDSRVVSDTERSHSLEINQD